jgi:hypothetical protein
MVVGSIAATEVTIDTRLRWPEINASASIVFGI